MGNTKVPRAEATPTLLICHSSRNSSHTPSFLGAYLQLGLRQHIIGRMNSQSHDATLAFNRSQPCQNSQHQCCIICNCNSLRLNFCGKSYEYDWSILFSESKVVHTWQVLASTGNNWELFATINFCNKLDLLTTISYYFATNAINQDTFFLFCNKWVLLATISSFLRANANVVQNICL